MQTDGVDDFDVVVLGGGPAGIAAALAAADEGARTALLSGGRLNGTCVNSGCVPTRVLARAARLRRDSRTASAFGVDVDPSPTVDWHALRRRVRDAVEAVNAAKDSAGLLRRAGVAVVEEGRARFVDQHRVRLESGREVRGGAFVVAVGGHATRLPIPGADLATVPDHLLDDLVDLPPSVAVIGSGNTGAQLATVFAAMGVATHLLDIALRVLPAADRDVSGVIDDAFRAAGVRLHLGLAGVDRLERADGGVRLRARESDGEPLVLDVGAVVMATGWPANVADIGLEAAGVEATRRAIPADGHQRSNVPHVYVAGDATGQAALAQAGVAEGRIAGRNAARGIHRGGAGTDHAILPSGGFTDPDYGQVGLTEDEARAADPGAVVVTVPYARLERAVIDDRREGFLKLIASADRGRLLGAHAVGEEALEVIQAVAAAMTTKADLHRLARTEFAYPTYTEIIGVAARELVGV